MKKLSDKINEALVNEAKHINERSNSNIDQYFKRLRIDHPRSGYTEDFIEMVQDLLSGKTKELARSEFKTGRGDQWGKEFIDYLVTDGILGKIKKGRKEYIVPIDNKQLQGDNIDTLFDDIEKNILNIRPDYIDLTDPVFYKVDRKKEEINARFKDIIVTWFHYEKGSGETSSSKDIKDREKQIEKEILGQQKIVDIASKIKSILGKEPKIKISNTDRGDIRSFQPDGHKGYLYSVFVTISLKK